VYPEPLASQIRAALESEAPGEILAVADALVDAGLLEDSLEWRKWYVHLRPGDEHQAEVLGQTRQAVARVLRQVKWKTIGQGIDYYAKFLASGKIDDPRILAELGEMLTELQRLYAAGDESGVYAAYTAFIRKLVAASPDLLEPG